MKIFESKNKIIYIAEFSLPNMSAYAVHVLKMCDNFSKFNKVELILPYKDNKYNFSQIKKEYNLKNKFEIKGIFNSKSSLNLFYRIVFALKIKSYVKNSLFSMIISKYYSKLNTWMFRYQKYIRNSYRTNWCYKIHF